MRALNSCEISAVFGGRALQTAQTAPANGTITVNIGNVVQYSGTVADLSATIGLAKTAIQDVAYEAADTFR